MTIDFTDRVKNGTRALMTHIRVDKKSDEFPVCSCGQIFVYIEEFFQHQVTVVLAATAGGD